MLALYKDDDCDDDDNIQNVIGYALGYCDVDNDEGTSEKLVKVDGKFVSNKYATDDCSGNVMEADTFVDGVCRSFGDLKVSTTVYTKPISYENFVDSGTANIAGWSVVLVMAAVYLALQ